MQTCCQLGLPRLDKFCCDAVFSNCFVVLELFDGFLHIAYRGSALRLTLFVEPIILSTNPMVFPAALVMAALTLIRQSLLVVNFWCYQLLRGYSTVSPMSNFERLDTYLTASLTCRWSETPKIDTRTGMRLPVFAPRLVLTSIMSEKCLPSIKTWSICDSVPFDDLQVYWSRRWRSRMPFLFVHREALKFPNSRST